jgi:hypothetical protein
LAGIELPPEFEDDALSGARSGVIAVELENELELRLGGGETALRVLRHQQRR